VCVCVCVCVKGRAHFPVELDVHYKDVVHGSPIMFVMVGLCPTLILQKLVAMNRNLKLQGHAKTLNFQLEWDINPGNSRAITSALG
jgi:hypothetical protein